MGVDLDAEARNGVALEVRVVQRDELWRAAPPEEEKLSERVGDVDKDQVQRACGGVSLVTGT